MAKIIRLPTAAPARVRQPALEAAAAMAKEKKKRRPAPRRKVKPVQLDLLDWLAAQDAANGPPVASEGVGATSEGAKRKPRQKRA